MHDNQIQALITLLDDTDKQVFNAVEKKLLELGTHVIPMLEKAWESPETDALRQTRIENIITQIYFDDTFRNLSRWAFEGGKNLLEGAFLLARYQYRDIYINDLNNAVEDILQNIRYELEPSVTPLEKIKVINHVLFDIEKFQRNTANIFAIQNCYINDVIEKRKGNHISLAILYLHITQQLQLPVFPINLPRNFLLAYADERALKQKGQLQTFDDILFYFNPNSKGIAFNKKEIDYYLNQQKITPHESYFMPCSNIEMIKELAEFLIIMYEKNGYTQKIEHLQKIAQELQEIQKNISQQKQI